MELIISITNTPDSQNYYSKPVSTIIYTFTSNKRDYYCWTLLNIHQTEANEAWNN